MYNYFHEGLEILLDMHAPLKPLSNKQIKKTKKPWITNEILNQITYKNQLYGHFMQTGDNNTFLKYKSTRNIINHKIRKSKFCYYKNYFTTKNSGMVSMSFLDPLKKLTISLQ